MDDIFFDGDLVKYVGRNDEYRKYDWVIKYVINDARRAVIETINSEKLKKISTITGWLRKVDLPPISVDVSDYL